MKVLNRSKSPEILILLLREEKLSLSDINYKLKTGAATVSKRVSELKEAKLITEKRYTDFTRKREFTLTEKGRKVAALLLEIKKVLEEEFTE